MPKEGEVKMNIEGMASGLVKNMDKVGLAAGILTGNPWGTTAVMDIATRAISGQIHIPDLSTAFGWVAQSGGFRTSIMGIIGGWVLQEIAPGKFGKWGKALQDLSVGYIEGTTLIMLAAAATSKDSGSDPNSPSYNPNWVNAGSRTTSPVTNGSRGYEGY